MSWQDYITSYLQNHTTPEGKTYANACEHAMLCGKDDGTIWATTAGFEFKTGKVGVANEDGSETKIDVNEFANLLQAFDNEGNCTNKGGLRINGEIYFMVSFDGDRNCMYLKKTGGGAVVAKSNLAFVIATCNVALQCQVNGKSSNQTPGVINTLAEILQNFLVENSL